MHHVAEVKKDMLPYPFFRRKHHIPPADGIEYIPQVVLLLIPEMVLRKNE